MSDLISRQLAINAICTEGTRLEHNGTVAMAEIKQWCVDILEELPSAQPEIIRCKECKHFAKKEGDERWSIGDCSFWEKHLVMCEGYCAWAERRTDE